MTFTTALRKVFGKPRSFGNKVGRAVRLKNPMTPKVTVGSIAGGVATNMLWLGGLQIIAETGAGLLRAGGKFVSKAFKSAAREIGKESDEAEVVEDTRGTKSFR